MSVTVDEVIRCISNASEPNILLTHSDIDDALCRITTVNQIVKDINIGVSNGYSKEFQLKLLAASL